LANCRFWLALREQTLGSTDASQHLDGTITHRQRIDINGPIEVASLLVYLSQSEVDIGVIGIGLASLIVFTQHRVVVALSLAAQLPANTSKHFQRSSAAGTKAGDHGNVPAHQRGNIARIDLEHTLVLCDSLLGAPQFL